MKHLGKQVDVFLRNKKNPTSQRAHLIQSICDTFFDDKDFKKILGQTSQFTIAEIRDIFEQAKSWRKNPQALFWKLLREKQGAIQNQIQDNKSVIAASKGSQ